MTDYTKQLFTANVMHDKGYSEDEAKAYIEGIIDCGFTDMYAKLNKMCDWLDAQASVDEAKAKTERFLTLKDAYIADAKNYRAMAKDLRLATSKAEGK